MIVLCRVEVIVIHLTKRFPISSALFCSACIVWPNYDKRFPPYANNVYPNPFLPIVHFPMIYLNVKDLLRSAKTGP